MLNTLPKLKLVVDRQEVDLTQLQLLVHFVFYGFTMEPDFKILKGADDPPITKDEALRIKAKIFRLFDNKPKARLRTLLPAVFLGIINFAIQKKDGVSLPDRLSSFTNLIYTLSVRRTSRSRTRTLRQLSTLLDLPPYKAELNAFMDPYARVFDGVTPDSFTNANAEFKEVLNLQQGVQLVPPSPDAEEKDIKLIPANKDTLTKVVPEDDGDVYRFLWGGDNKVITFTDEQLTYFGAALAAGGIMSFLITRKRLRKLRGI